MQLFKINNSVWTIELVDKDTLLKKYNEDSEEKAFFAYGVTLFSSHEIWINKDMCFDQQINTLKHELTHCFIFNYGMFNVPHYTEEMVCDIVANINDFINTVIEDFKRKNENKVV